MRAWLRLTAVLLLWPVATAGDGVPVTVEGGAAARVAAEPWVAAMRGTVDVDGGLMRLAAQREGLIAEIFVAEGATVEDGQLLARIDDASARLQVRAAELELAQARAQLAAATLRVKHTEEEVARLTPAARVDAIPRKQIEDARHLRDTARAEALVAEATVRLVQSRVDVAALEVTAREVRAPAPGVILRASAKVGDATTTNTVTEMFLLAPDGPRVLRGMLDEQFLGRVAVGQRAVLFSERDASVKLPSRVIRIAPVFGRPGETQSEARSVEVVLLIEGEAARSLILGERLVARFPAPVSGSHPEQPEIGAGADGGSMADRTAPGPLGSARRGDTPSL